MKFDRVKIVALIIALTVFLSAMIISMVAVTDSQVSIKDNKSRNMDIHDVAATIYSKIPTEYFGGMYINDEGNLVVNVTDIQVIPESSRESMTETRDSIKVIYKTVDKSLQELTIVKNKLTKYMIEYGIAVLDADDVTNLIDITLYYDHPKSIEEVEALAKTFIDLKYVNITVLPEDVRIEPTVAYVE